MISHMLQDVVMMLQVSHHPHMFNFISSDVLVHQPGLHPCLGPLHRGLLPLHLPPGPPLHGPVGLRVPRAVRQELPRLQPLHLLLLQRRLPARAARPGALPLPRA